MTYIWWMCHTSGYKILLWWRAPTCSNGNKCRKHSAPPGPNVLRNQNHKVWEPRFQDPATSFEVWCHDDRFHESECRQAICWTKSWNLSTSIQISWYLPKKLIHVQLYEGDRNCLLLLAVLPRYLVHSFRDIFQNKVQIDFILKN